MAAVREEAEAVDAAEPAVAETNAGKGRRKLLIIGGAALLVAGLAGGAAFYFLRAAPSDAAQEATASAAPVHKQALYLNLRPDFIVNSTAVGQRRYLQTNVAVMARDQAVIDSYLGAEAL